MTPQEQQLLDGLIGRVKSAPQTAKDPEAVRLIQSGLGGDPDALYVLCQTTLVQSYALQQAQTQLQQAREQVSKLQAQGSEQPEHQPGFLERVFGSHSSVAHPQPASSTQPGYGTTVFQGRGAAGQGQDLPQGGQAYPAQGQPYPPPAYGQLQYGQPQYSQPQYSQPQYAQPGYGPMGGGGGMMGGLMGGGGGGFLQGAMQVAAGVAAGELLTQGLEGMMHGFGHAAGYGSDHDVLGGGGRGFTDSDSSRDSNDAGGDSTFHDSVQQDPGTGLSSDIEDRRGGSNFLGDSGDGSASGFSGADTSDSGSGAFSGDDSGSYDGGGSLDSGSDDFSGGDDGGGSFDDGNS